MVEWVYSAKADTSNPSARGFRNELALKEPKDLVRLEATYTDLGRGDIPALTGTTAVTLRSRHVQAESADDYKGTKPLSADKAEGKKFMGAIDHDGYLRFKQIPLEADEADCHPRRQRWCWWYCRGASGFQRTDLCLEVL